MILFLAFCVYISQIIFRVLHFIFRISELLLKILLYFAQYKSCKTSTRRADKTHNLDSISTTVNVEVKPVPSPGEQHMGGSGAHVFV